MVAWPRIGDALDRHLPGLGLGGGKPEAGALLKTPRGGRTVAGVIAEIGPALERRWRDRLAAVGIDWPPQGIVLLGLKQEKHLEVWAAAGERRWVRVGDYPIRAASGGAGPKLREGDRQVPEGVYRIVGLNPNSRYHLSMKLDYPNASERAWAARDGRTNLGGDIFIHGRAASIGCLAMGDPAIEELFVLVHGVGRGGVKVVIVPNDLRGGRSALGEAEGVAWLGELHDSLRREVAALAE